MTVNPIYRLRMALRQEASFPRDRERFTAREFVRRFFGESESQSRVAYKLRLHYEGQFNLDLSRLRPDDTLGDFLPGFSPSALASTAQPDSRSSFVEEAIEEVVIVRAREIAFGPFAESESGWDPETLPVRTFRALVLHVTQRKAFGEPRPTNRFRPTETPLP
ncbi:MAG: hypothetical protein GY719_07025 [bacterium]|nr:hypothetical protein [bacterium]